MFESILWLYKSIFQFLYVLSSMIIFTYFARKIKHIIYDDKISKRSGFVLITGCDSGFGLATALALSKENVYTFAGCLTADGVRTLTENHSFYGMALLMDIRKKNEIESVRQIIENKVGANGLDCLINNAGICEPGPIEWMSVDDMKRSMEVNLWGTVNVTKTMLPLLKKCEGRIVNMTSISGRVSDTNFSSYAMTKYALEAFSDCLRYESKPWGVSVHIIEPGHHETNLFSNIEERWENLWNIQPKHIQQEYGEDYRKDVLRVTKHIMSAFSSNNQDVVDSYIHAATSSQPRLRYVVGLDAQTAGLLVANIPTDMADFVRSMIFTTVTPAACKKTQ